MEKILWGGSFFILLLVAMAFLPHSPYSLSSAIGTTDSVVAELKEMSAAFPLVFGGRVVAVVPCTCSGGVAIGVGTPRPGYVLFQTGFSVLFSFYAPYVLGNYVLGTYVPGGACFTGVPPVCAAQPVLGTVVLIGTSATPL